MSRKGFLGGDGSRCGRGGGSNSSRGSSLERNQSSLDPLVHLLLLLLPPHLDLLLGRSARLFDGEVVLGVGHEEELVRADADLEFDARLSDERRRREGSVKCLDRPPEEGRSDAGRKTLGRVVLVKTRLEPRSADVDKGSEEGRTDEDEALDIGLPLLLGRDGVVEREVVLAEQLDQKRLGVLDLRQEQCEGQQS